MKERIIKVGKMHIFCCIVLSILINMAIEALSRKSVFKLFEYIILNRGFYCEDFIICK